MSDRAVNLNQSELALYECPCVSSSLSANFSVRLVLVMVGSVSIGCFQLVIRTYHPVQLVLVFNLPLARLAFLSGKNGSLKPALNSPPFSREVGCTCEDDTNSKSQHNA